MKFFNALGGYQHVGKAMNYLYTIASNLCKDYNRKNLWITTEEVPEPKENPLDDSFKKVDDKLTMEQILGQLSDELREVIILQQH